MEFECSPCCSSVSSAAVKQGLEIQINAGAGAALERGMDDGRKEGPFTNVDDFKGSFLNADGRVDGRPII